jgi:methylenetetrahydrofolate reductase (NADPH)
MRPSGFSRPSLAKAVASGRFVLTTSVGTLPEADEALLRRRLRQVREAFGFVKFGDNPRARARVSAWAAAAVAIGEDVEPIVHVGCRDRNRLAIQADLLGGRLLGVQNVLCLRGDDIGISTCCASLAARQPSSSLPLATLLSRSLTRTSKGCARS